MAAGFGTAYNPSAVMMARPNVANAPYLGTKPPVVTGGPINSPVSPASPASPAASAPSGSSVLAATANRATGPSAGYDPAYLQNLVTYGAGQYQQPSGGFRFNPTQISSFPGMPTGGGTAPVPGTPNTLLAAAQGGQGFSWNSPAVQSQAVSAAPGTATVNQSLQDWLQQFLSGTAPTINGGAS